MTQEIMKLAQNMVTEVMMGVAEQSGVDRVVVNVSGKAKAALQTALQSLATESETHKENAMRNARLAVVYRAERDALQAKLTELQKQEPVLWLCDWDGCISTMSKKPEQNNAYKSVTPLYASPKALEPLTEDRLWELWNAQGDDAMDGAAAFAFARAIEAAHGIGGQPT